MNFTVMPKHEEIILKILEMHSCDGQTEKVASELIKKCFKERNTNL